MAATLKVYRLYVGYHEYLVAADSAASAAKAWGVPMKVFAEGWAKEAGVADTEHQSLSRARAHPGQVYRRLRGTSGRFQSVEIAK